MKKLSRLALVLAFAALFLTGCGQDKLSVSDHHLEADGLAVVIKGKTNQDRVSYQIDNGPKKSVKSDSSAYTVMVPVQEKEQTVHLTAGSQKETVKVAKTKPLGSYSQIKQKYDQGLVITKLSAKDQKAVMAMQKQGQQLKEQQARIQKKVAADQKAVAQSQDQKAAADLQKQAQAGAKLKQEARELQQQQKDLKPKLAQAEKAAKKDQLPAKAKDGIHDLQQQKDFRLRANVTGDKVNALAVIVPVKTMKNKTQARDFILKFSTLASVVGADPKEVLKQFKKQMNTDRSTKTTTKSIHSKGVDFRIGISADHLYIYLLKVNFNV